MLQHISNEQGITDYLYQLIECMRMIATRFSSSAQGLGVDWERGYAIQSAPKFGINVVVAMKELQILKGEQ